MGHDVELERAEADFYRDVFEHTQNLIQVVNLDGRIQLVNPAWRTTLGYTEREAEGLQVMEVIHPDYRDHFREIRRLVLEGHSVPWLEMAMLTKDGKRIEVEGNIGCRFMDGKPVATRGIFRDITASKHAEWMLKHYQAELERRVEARTRDLSEALESLRISEGLLNHAQRIARLGSWDWDVTSGEIHWSDEAYRIYGLTRGRDEASLATFMSIVHPEDREAVAASIQVALEQRMPFDREVRLVRPDGSERHVHELGEMTFDVAGKPMRFIGIIQDITERKRAERELVRQSAELLMAEDLHRLKSDFVNALAQDLRTPLTSLKAYAEFLDDEVGGPLTAMQRDFLLQIQRNTRRLKVMVNDLEDYARIETNGFTLRLQVADLGKLLRETAESLQEPAKAAGIDLVVEPMDEPQILTLDSQRIEQVLVNALTDAMKLTPPGGRIGMRLRRDVASVRCEIEHSGERLAEEGAGMSVAICQHIIAAHGGESGIQSETGAGRTCWFSLPLDLDETDFSA